MIYVYVNISYIYNTGPEENQFFQPHLDDAHSKLVHRSNYLHFGTTSNRQISKATTQGWRPPAFTKRKSRNNLMSRSSLNNLRESNASRMLPCGLYVWVL